MRKPRETLVHVLCGVGVLALAGSCGQDPSFLDETSLGRGADATPAEGGSVDDGGNPVGSDGEPGEGGPAGPDSVTGKGGPGGPGGDGDTTGDAETGGSDGDVFLPGGGGGGEDWLPDWVADAAGDDADDGGAGSGSGGSGGADGSDSDGSGGVDGAGDGGGTDGDDAGDAGGADGDDAGDADAPPEIPGADGDDLGALHKCLAKWRNHPFQGKVYNYNRISASVTVGGFGNAINDTENTEEPWLTLIDAGVNVGGAPQYNLLNRNGYYCMKVNVNVGTEFVINLHCNARLADSKVNVNVGSSQNDTTSNVGVHVLSSVTVNSVRPGGDNCIR